MAVVSANDLKDLMSKKDAIEKEIKELTDVLESQKGVGMDGPLVDADQFPRSDIDLYTVRQARHRIICLQNDHKQLMKQIETGLYDIHAMARRKREDEHQKARTITQPAAEEISKSRAFILVDRVDLGSPAHQAGLEVGDLIVKFGSISSENYKTLQDIAKLTQHSIGKTISLLVIRSGKELHLGLIPNTWSGRGLLGCNVVPVER